MKYLSDYIDEYCKRYYGHTHWGYLNSISDEDLKEDEHIIEGSIVFWINDF